MFRDAIAAYLPATMSCQAVFTVLAYTSGLHLDIHTEQFPWRPMPPCFEQQAYGLFASKTKMSCYARFALTCDAAAAAVNPAKVPWLAEPVNQLAESMILM